MSEKTSPMLESKEDVFAFKILIYNHDHWMLLERLYILCYSIQWLYSIYPGVNKRHG